MKQILFALLAISLAAGCTTTRTYNSISAASAAQLEPGTKAVIELVDGSSEKVEIQSYADTSVEVVTEDDVLRSIDYADIRTIYAKELDKGRTTKAVIGGVLIAGLLGALAVAAEGPIGMPSGAPAL